LLKAILHLIGCSKQKEYQVYPRLRAREPGTPEQNSERLKEAIARHFEHARNRTDDQNLVLGRFFGILLLVERKLVQLLERFDPAVSEKTLGGKLQVFKEFLNELDQDYEIDDVEPQDYRKLLSPLNEIKRIRDAMAHTLSKTTFSADEIAQTSAYVRRKRPDLYDAAMSAATEIERCTALVAAFGIVFSIEIGGLDCLFD